MKTYRFEIDGWEIVEVKAHSLTAAIAVITKNYPKVAWNINLERSVELTEEARDYAAA